jgi:DNA polymerase
MTGNENNTECKWYTVCPMKRFFEKGRIEKHWVKDYCHDKWEECVRYKLEEEGKYHPDWMLPDGSLKEELKNK